jgi:uncharacterized protein YqhQ
MKGIELYGGGATNTNSIYFESSSYKVEAILNKDTNEITLNEKRLNKKSDKINKIPIVNVIYNLLKSLIIENNNRTGINVLPCVLVLSYILDKFLFRINLPDYLYLLYFLFVVIFAKLTNMRKMHGAEHMTFNYYDRNRKISYDNFDEIMREKRSVYACGTTHSIINITLLFVLKFIINDFMIRFILSNIISYNAVYLSYKYKIVKKILSPIFYISGILQIIFFISKPEDIHIKMAIATINRLEELENGSDK